MDGALTWSLRQQHVGGVWCDEGQSTARPGIQTKLHLGHLLLGLRVAFGPNFNQALAGGLQLGIAATLGNAFDRVLRNHGQRQSFGKAQVLGGFVKVNQAGRAHPFHVAAVGRGVEVRLQDVVLAVAQLQPQRAQDLRQLARQAAAVDAVQPPGQLHRQR